MIGGDLNFEVFMAMCYLPSTELHFNMAAPQQKRHSAADASLALLL